MHPLPGRHFLDDAPDRADCCRAGNPGRMSSCLHDVASQIKGKCLCALGEFSIEAVLSGIERFRRISRQSAPLDQDQPVDSLLAD